MDAQETRIFIAIIITAIVLGIIIGYFAISIIRQQKQNMALQKANILAEIGAMEKERSRIAADLHDQLGPVLSVVKFKVDYARHSEQIEHEQLDKASAQLDEMIERMREIANNLMPVTLLRRGLITAVEEYISKVERSSRVKFDFEYPANLRLPEYKAIHVYRTLQEVIHNCVKHSGASKMEIKLEQADEQLKILCRDNGKGFDPEKVNKESSGIGLMSLKNRTEILGGSMIMESEPGRGAAFLFVISLK